MQRILDTINAPAYVRNGRMDILAANRLGRALFADAYGTGATFNLARYLFLDPRARDFYLEWATVAHASVAALRAEAGRNPYDRGLTDLVGQLSTRSEEFRTWWATHDVKLHHTATKTLHHPIAGDLELTGEALHLPGDPGLTIITYTWEPSSPTEQALAFLAAWSTREASPGAAEQSAVTQYSATGAAPTAPPVPAIAASAIADPPSTTGPPGALASAPPSRRHPVTAIRRSSYAPGTTR